MSHFLHRIVDWLPQSASRLRVKIQKTFEQGDSQRTYFLLERYLHLVTHNADDIMFGLSSIDLFYERYGDTREAPILTVSVLQFIARFPVLTLPEPLCMAFFRVHTMTYHIMCDYFIRRRDIKNLEYFYDEYTECLQKYANRLPREHVALDVYFKLLCLQYLDDRREDDDLTDDEYHWERIFLEGLGEAIESLYTCSKLVPLTYVEEFDAIYNLDYIVYMWMCHGRDAIHHGDGTHEYCFEMADTLAKKVQYMARKDNIALNGETQWTHLAIQYYKTKQLPDRETLHQTWNLMKEEEQECALLTLVLKHAEGDQLLAWVMSKN